LPGPLPADYATWDAAGASSRAFARENTEIQGLHGSVVDRQRQPINFRSRRLPVI